MGNPKQVGSVSNVVNGYVALRALNRKPSLLRASLYEPTLRLLLCVCLGLFTAWTGLVGISEGVKNAGPDPGLLSKVFVVLGGIAMLLFFLLGWITWKVWKAIKRNFANGLLSAGMIVEENPLTIVALANVGTGSGEGTLWGVVRSSPRALPGHQLGVNEQVPCVCTFQPGDDEDRWGDIEPMPVCHGLGGAKILRSANEAIGDWEYTLLGKLIKQGWIPEDDEHMVIIEQGGSPETVVRSRVTRPWARSADR